MVTHSKIVHFICIIRSLKNMFLINIDKTRRIQALHMFNKGSLFYSHCAGELAVA
jgi:hypothetical protein